MSDNEAGPAGGAAGGASADDLSLPKATIAKLVTGECTRRVFGSLGVASNQRRHKYGTGAHLSVPSPMSLPPFTVLLRLSPPSFPAARTSEYLSNDLTAGKDVKEFLGDCCKGEAVRLRSDNWRLGSLTPLPVRGLRATLHNRVHLARVKRSERDLREECKEDHPAGACPCGVEGACTGQKGRRQHSTLWQAREADADAT